MKIHALFEWCWCCYVVAAKPSVEYGITVPIMCKYLESVLLPARLRGLPMPRSGPMECRPAADRSAQCAVCLALTGSCDSGPQGLACYILPSVPSDSHFCKPQRSSTNEKARQTRNFVLQAVRIGGIMHKAAPCSGRPTRAVLLLLVGRHTTQPGVIPPRISPSFVQERNSQRTWTPPWTPSPHSL